MLWRHGGKNCRTFRMCLSLNNYQFRTSMIIDIDIDIQFSLMVTRKPTKDAQKTKRKEYKYNTKENKTIMEVIIKRRK